MADSKKHNYFSADPQAGWLKLPPVTNQRTASGPSKNTQPSSSAPKKSKSSTLWLPIIAGLILIIIPISIILAKKALLKKPTAYPVSQVSGLTCYPNGGMDKKYDSNALVVENKTDHDINVWVQWNMCDYNSDNLPKEGYQCNKYVNRKTNITIKKGEKKEFSAKTAGSGLENADLNGKVIQIDANTEGDAGGGCYLPDGKTQWSGGLAFAIKAYPPQTPITPQPTGKVVCYPNGGMDKKYDSNALVVENKTDHDVNVWVQWNQCDYKGSIPPADGYQCNKYVNRKTNITIKKGEKKEFSAKTAGSGLENASLNCSAVQIDANTEGDAGGGCYLPDGKTQWSGGLAFAIKGYKCQAATPTLTPSTCQVTINGQFKNSGKYEVTLNGNQDNIKAASYVCGGYNHSYCNTRGPNYINSQWLIGAGGAGKAKWGNLSGSKKFDLDYKCNGSIQVDVNYCKKWNGDQSQCLEVGKCASKLDKAPDCPTPTIPLVGTSCHQVTITKINGQTYRNQTIKPKDVLNLVGYGFTDVNKTIDNIYFTVFKGNQIVDEGDGKSLSFTIVSDKKRYTANYQFTVPDYGNYSVSIAVHGANDSWYCTN